MLGWLDGVWLALLACCIRSCCSRCCLQVHGERESSSARPEVWLGAVRVGAVVAGGRRQGDSSDAEEALDAVAAANERLVDFFAPPGSVGILKQTLLLFCMLFRVVECSGRVKVEASGSSDAIARVEEPDGQQIRLARSAPPPPSLSYPQARRARRSGG